MNVLSLFDGMSCGQQALDRLGLKINNYFASEIDKYAITVTMANYPNTIQLGSVTNVDGYSLPKIDLLIGGSPCQSFSFAGKRKGMSTKDNQEILTLNHYLELKEQEYEFEGQSYLFWEYMRLLKETNPKYFLLENVMMGEKWEKILTKAIGVNPIMINSSLVSAQNRQRLYWTNIGMESAGLFGDLESIITLPKDKNIFIKDILENKVDKKYYLSNKAIQRIIRHKNKSLNNIKSNCITSRYYTGGGRDQQYIIHNTMPRSGDAKKGGTGPLARVDGKTYCLDTGNTNAIEYNKNIRRFTPLECERLQTIKDNYTNYVSDSQRYRMLGNGWTIDIIAYIFKYLKL
jgi:DNA (cytosine-5)-methyltransferase 3A